MALMLDASRNFKSQITALNDFVLPCAGALWNLRWQVRGYIEESPAATKSELHGRFVGGSGIGSANLRRFAMEQSWQEQKESLARLILVNQLTLFEIWQSELPGLTAEERAMVPHTSAATGRWNDRHARWEVGEKLGWPDFLNGLEPDPELARCFPPSERSDEPIQSEHLDQLMLAFRVFKEARNGLVHAGIGNRKGEETCRRFSSLPPLLVSKNVAKAPLAVPMIFDGQPIRLTLEMVTGFMSVLYRILVTTDSVLGISGRVGRSELLRQCQRVFPRGLVVGVRTTPDRKARMAMTTVRYPPPLDASVLADILRDAGILRAP